MARARLVPLLFLPFLSGCLFTAPMWQAANETVFIEPRPYAVIEPTEQTASPRRGLIVRYSRHDTEGLYVIVPLTPAGRPIDPFTYAGEFRRPEQIDRGLSPAQRQQLRQTRLTPHDERWARHLASRPGFRKLNWQTDGISAPYDSPIPRPATAPCRCTGRHPDLRIRSLRLDCPWTDAERADMPLPVGSPILYPPDAQVLILPYAQPRPRAQRRHAQFRAALLTPLTLAADAVTIPLLYVACYGFGQCP